MNRTALIGGAVAIVVVVVVVWAVFSRGGIQPGFGDYEAQGRECEEEVFSNLMHPSDLQFVEGREWHQVDGDDLHIGGLITLLNDAGDRLGHDFTCLFRGGRLIIANVE